MTPYTRIRVEEPSVVKESFFTTEQSILCALCSFVFEHGDLMCMAYVSHTSSEQEEVLGTICMACRDAGPDVIKKQLCVQADLEECQAEFKYSEGQRLLACAEVSARHPDWLKDLASKYLLEAETRRSAASRLRKLSHAEIQCLQEMPEPACVYLKPEYQSQEDTEIKTSKGQGRLI